jgi:hypothetical protein
MSKPPLEERTGGSKTILLVVVLLDVILGSEVTLWIVVDMSA